MYGLNGHLALIVDTLYYTYTFSPEPLNPANPEHPANTSSTSRSWGGQVHGGGLKERIPLFAVLYEGVTYFQKK